ncbi:MAG: hypothetical protein JSS98_02900 [Bacteroidetes bacterium]|nr:hypothetical protein [Bacteroidota bacterium]
MKIVKQIAYFKYLIDINSLGQATFLCHGAFIFLKEFTIYRNPFDFLVWF